jgi:hypothetical protein
MTIAHQLKLAIDPLHSANNGAIRPSAENNVSGVKIAELGPKGTQFVRIVFNATE